MIMRFAALCLYNMLNDALKNKRSFLFEQKADNDAAAII